MAITENELVQKALEAMKSIFAEVPNASVKVEQPTPSTRTDLVTPDFLFEVRHNSHSHTLAVNVKAQGYPQQLSEAIDHLIKYRYRTKRFDDLVVVAPFITKEGAAICRADDVNYLDLAGNCRISLSSGIFIERIGAPSPFQPKPATAGLYGTRAERILRVLFHDPKKPWKVVPLAETAKTSLGTVSTVRRQLIERDWAKETPAGLVLTQPQQLLSDWATAWGRRRTKPVTYFTRQPFHELEKRIAVFTEMHRTKFALTGTAGAWRHAPMVRPNRLQFYWSGDRHVMDQLFGLQRVEDGANVQVFEPRDVGVFDFLDMIDGVPVVCPTQLYLDLQHDAARGEEAAKHLWSTVLFPDA